MKLSLVYLVLLLVAPAAVAESDDYRLGPGDEVKIDVHEEADLSMTMRIGESGIFRYPYLGNIRATGRSVAELEDILTTGLLQDILVKPSVNVSIVTYRNFYIGGEVKAPGGYPYHPGLTVFQAMTVAGGPAEWASSSKFEILREGQSTPIAADKATLVRPGDTVTILEGIF
jgi:protein involved in polysaccharide export with SLBB domain